MFSNKMIFCQFMTNGIPYYIPDSYPAKYNVSKDGISSKVSSSNFFHAIVWHFSNHFPLP